LQRVLLSGFFTLRLGGTRRFQHTNTAFRRRESHAGMGAAEFPKAGWLRRQDPAATEQWDACRDNQ